MSNTAPSPITLALYRDADLVPVIERPKFSPQAPSAIIEFARRSRLRAALPVEAPVGPAAIGAHRVGGLRTPFVFAPRQRRSAKQTLRTTRRLVHALAGPVVLLCHVDDAPALVGDVGPIVASRLIWHPADRADEAVATVVDLLDDLQVRPTQGVPLVYLATGDRPATMTDWRVTVACPVLDAFRAGRRLRHMQVTSGLEHLYDAHPPQPRAVHAARAS